MSEPMSHFKKSLCMLVASALALAGCETMDPKKEAVQVANEIKTGPEQKPFVSVTNFATPLRCMDNLMISYGVRDISVITEDIVDQTKKVNAGTKDMLISAVSDMTRRSRAIKLIAYGQDSGNLIGFMKEAERKNVYAAMPQYGIKGSISQFDDNIAKKSQEFGFAIGNYLNVGAGKSAALAMIGLDLTVLSAVDLSVVPGVTSRNAVLVTKSGSGFEGDAQYRKFGINYSTTLGRAEGNTQALRNLVELAAIELVGKLTKTPYWTCMGSSAKDEGVKQEIADWFYAMEANGAELVAWLQLQLRNRGYYRGQVTGEGSPELVAAVIAYRKAIGMSAEAKADLDLFTAMLETSTPTAVAGTSATTTTAKPAPAAPAAPVDNSPVQIAIEATNGAAKWKRGEPVSLALRTSRDGYVYCFIRDDENKVQRFYPNRYTRDALVSSREPVQIPGKMRFTFFASSKGVTENIACFASPRDILTELPETLRGTDFEPLKVSNIDQVKQAFGQLGGTPITFATYNVEVASR